MQKTGLTEILLAAGIVSLFTAGAFGAFGAIIHYLYLVVKEEEPHYRFSRMFAFAVMGFGVGIFANELIQATLGQTLPGAVLVSGFLFLKILDFLSDSGFEQILNKFGFKKK